VWLGDQRRVYGTGACEQGLKGWISHSAEHIQRKSKAKASGWKS